MTASASDGMQALLIEEAPRVGELPAIDPHYVCSTNALSGFNTLRALGVVRGVTVRSRSIGADIGAGFKSLVGGEIKTMTTLCESTRQEALKRMLANAAERGANGVVAVRYDTNCISPGITEVIAYGMAVTSVGSQASSTDDSIDQRVCTSNEVPGYSVHRSMGIVKGLTVRSRNAIANIGAGFKSMVGGEIKTYTTMCETARQEAYARMLAEAMERGADGVVAMRYDTNEVTDGVTEVFAFGTAVSSTDGTDSASVSEKKLARTRCVSQLQLLEAVARNMVTTSTSLPGLSTQHSLGVVRGITVRSSHLLANIGAGFKTLVGGEVRTWSRMCNNTREDAYMRMLEQANQLGAKGIVAMRYDSNEVTPGIIEVVAYGTAVSDQPCAHSGVEGLAPHLVSTNLEIHGHTAQCSLGVVRGISVRSVNLMRTIGAGFKTIVGGEIRNYTAMCEAARAEAHERMVQHATEMGATAIVGMRYESNDLKPGVIEVVAYGTALSDGSRVAAEATGSSDVINSALISTTNDVVGRPMPRSLGVVRGITVRSRNVAANIGAGLKARYIGGEITTWTNLCEMARTEACERLMKEASDCGASGIVALRYETNEIAPGITEVLAYGTAVA